MSQFDLHDSIERNKALLGAIPDMMFIISSDGHFIDYNAEDKKDLYSDPQLFLGKSVNDILPPEVAQTTMKYIEEARRTQQLQSYEYSLEIAGKQQFFESRMIQCGQDEFLAIVRNVSDRKKAEQLILAERDLAMSLSRFTSLSEGLEECLRVAIRISEMDSGGIYFAEEGSLRLITHLGLSEQFITACSFYAPDTENAKLVMNGVPFYIENQLAGLDLEKLTEFEKINTLAIIPIFSQNKIIACLNVASHTATDIPTPFRHALENIAAFIGMLIQNLQSKEALLENQKLFELFMDYVPAAVFIKDKESRTLFVNKYFKQLFGEKEWIGAKPTDFIPRDFSIQMEEDDKRALQAGYLMKTEAIPDQHGNMHWFDTQKFTLQAPGKQTVLGGIALEVTERIKTQEDMLAAKEKAEESDRLKSAFLANLSHEIRTPMNGILGFSKLLKSTDLTENERDHYVEIINSCGNQLLAIITDIIEISKIETKQLKLNLKKTDIDKLMDAVLDNFSIKASRNKNLQLLIKKPKQDKPLCMKTDEVKLKQILSNLIENALKFTERGTVEFGYKQKFPDLLEFFVRDTGIGIGEKHLEIIFDRFQKIEADSIKSQGGMGLGLAISKAYVELLGGKIWVESELEKGTAFYFSIPMVQIEETEVEQILTARHEWINLKDKTILVAEDEEINRFYLDLILSKTYAKLLYAKDGKQAVDMFVSNPGIDIILMDIKMPIKSGFDAIKEIRKLNDKVPIIAQTAHAFEEEKQRAFDSGCDDYIAKPIEKDELIKIISRHMNK